MRLLQHGRWLFLVAGLTGWHSFAEERSDSSPTNASESIEIRVLDVVLTSADRLRIGTNTMSLAAATNFIAAKLDTLDVVAVHGPEVGMAPVDAKSSAMARIASVGVPLVIVEKEGEYAWREQSGGDGFRAVQVGTDHLTAIRRLWKRQRANPEAVPETTVRTTVQWDTDTGTYALSRVELGLFGKRVWLMHEQRDSDEEPRAVGIQFKKEW